MSAHGSATPLKITPGMLNSNSGSQQQLETLLRDQPNLEQGERMSTMLPMEINGDLPPNIRQPTRWDYLEEYIGYWKMDHVCRVLGAFLLAFGIASLNVFAPGALLMIAVSARLIDLGWWNNFIWSKFGTYRTITLVD